MIDLQTLIENTPSFARSALNWCWSGFQAEPRLPSADTGVPPAWKEMNIIEHFLKLHDQLQPLTAPGYEVYTYVKSKEYSPIKSVRFYLDENGLPQIHEDTLKPAFKTRSENSWQITAIDEPVKYTRGKAIAISTALYRMVLALDYSTAEDRYQCKLSIGSLLLKPFCKFHLSEEDAKQVLARYRQNMYNFSRRTQQKRPLHLKNENEAAIQMQRLFRRSFKHKKYKENKPSTINTPASELIVDMPKDVRGAKEICKPTLPKTYPSFTKEKREQLEKEFRGVLPQDKNALSRYIVCYKSHKKFMNRLKQAIERLNEHLFSLPEAERGYVLVVPSVHESKSNHWATGLSMPFLRFKPTAIIEKENLMSFCEAHPAVKNAVFIDDAIYSGEQMTSYTGTYNLDINKIVIVPFYTSQRNITSGAMVIGSEQMITPSSAKVGCPKDLGNKVGTFFSHRVADYKSTFFEGFGIYPDLILAGEHILAPYKS